MEKIYIIIPALEPERDLINYIQKLSETIKGEIVLIDDGSGREYREIFRRAEAVPGCTVLYHKKNLGKGRALKTGFKYAGDRTDERSWILCADSDGQHAAEDMISLLAAAQEHPGALILGVRKFWGKGIPVRSFLGNWISSLMFYLACGVWLRDTQTGFRAFDSSLLQLFLQIPGERFEYEMWMLKVCAQKGIPFHTREVQTIYIDGNQGSHFRPIRDSHSVMQALLRKRKEEDHG